MLDPVCGRNRRGQVSVRESDLGAPAGCFVRTTVNKHGESFKRAAGRDSGSGLRTNRPHGVLLTFAGEDADASNFAHDLAQALREGGWDVSGPFPAAYVPMAGVLIGVDDFSSAHPSAWLLVDVLTAVGIKTRVVQASVTGVDRCCLMAHLSHSVFCQAPL